MIAPIQAALGEPITFTGYADDYGNELAGIQFSLDGGSHWTTYGLAGASPDLWVRWTFTYTPVEPGSYQLRARSVRRDGAVSPQAAVAAFKVG